MDTQKSPKRRRFDNIIVYNTKNSFEVVEAKFIPFSKNANREKTIKSLIDAQSDLEIEYRETERELNQIKNFTKE